MTGPDRASFSSNVIANGEDEIHVGSGREFVPALRAEFARVMTERLQQRERVRVYGANRVTACRPSGKAAFAGLGENGLCHDRPGGIASAQEQDIVDLIGHGRACLRAGNAERLFRPAR
jgi:hypothetical protein